MVKMLKRQIEKRIDVLQARYYHDEDIFMLESSLLKISTSTMLENPEICRVVRHHGARIVEVNPTYAAVEKTGTTEDILSLFENLNSMGAVLQFARSGRICITRGTREQLDDYLAEREKERRLCEKDWCHPHCGRSFQYRLSTALELDDSGQVSAECSWEPRQGTWVRHDGIERKPLYMGIGSSDHRDG